LVEQVRSADDQAGIIQLVDEQVWDAPGSESAMYGVSGEWCDHVVNQFDDENEENETSAQTREISDRIVQMDFFAATRTQKGDIGLFLDEGERSRLNGEIPIERFAQAWGHFAREQSERDAKHRRFPVDRESSPTQ
jgi:hypothetical protein